MSGPLTDHFLGTLASELDGEDVVGIVLGGSHARGDATPYSDVDIACFVTEEGKQRKKQFMYRDGYLVSIAIKSVDGARADMLRPNMAIWVVPGLSPCRVLMDKDGSVGALLREIRAFEWEPLQRAADEYASRAVMRLAEIVHKIVGEVLVRGDEQAIAYAASGMLFGLTEAVAVQRGVMVKSDSTYYAQVQEAAGPASAWTAYHRLVSGVEEGVSGDPPALVQGISALGLYRQTVALLSDAMEPAHLEVAAGALRVIEQAGLA